VDVKNSFFVERIYAALGLERLADFKKKAKSWQPKL
jgi:hypothetical protein